MTALAVFVLQPAAATDASPPGGWTDTIRRVDPDTPTLTVTDLAASRGDGIFETLGVVGGHPQAVTAHLDRLAGSAAKLELPAPNLEQWRTAVDLAAACLPTIVQGGLKLVISRGVDGAGAPTGWILASTADREFPERRDGISAITLDRGYSSDVARRSPWLLAGAKTLSYAVNMAALREAHRRGADDAIFVTTDGFVMEAPTATVIVRHGDTFTTPSTDVGILPGTSQLSLFDFYREAGYRTEQRPMRVDELAGADGIWLVSSVRLAAPVVRLDGAAIAHDPAVTDGMNRALLERVD